MEFITQSAEETKDVGRKVAAGLKKQGGVVALVGDLGSGKTTFVQGFARGLGIEGRVISPTFILVREYDFKGRVFLHLDLYRLEKDVEDEVRMLGVEDLWGRKGNIAVVEWAEKIKDLIPEGSTWIYFENLGEDRRRIRIKENQKTT